ncbi:hypothetical protein Q1695_007501 [Nippostrongylus brasiliensis]|nr:hypothetical protein Q1695_007501 [Nippostrongylus brasiliensis]
MKGWEVKNLILLIMFSLASAARCRPSDVCSRFVHGNGIALSMLRLMLISTLAFCATGSLSAVNSTIATCRVKTRSKCFLGQCPTDYTCLPSGECCDSKQVVLPPFWTVDHSATTRPNKALMMFVL